MWMIGGLISSAADLPTRGISDRFNIDGCMIRGHMNDVWVFNPKGWSREAILGDAASKYSHFSTSQVLPVISGYEDRSLDSIERDNIQQDWSDFRLYDQSEPSIQQALDEGWECTGVQGKWCRKPFLNRYTKGAESQVMCFEYIESETEDRSSSSSSQSGQMPRRPRSCHIDETKNQDNNCICYIIQAAGQQGPKQTADGAGFRPEIDYLEVRRADGTYGSDRAFYRDSVKEHCKNAQATYPNVDQPIDHDAESAVQDPTECTSQCGGSGQVECNREWKKINLRRRWHEAGRIEHGRMGSLSGVLKGELLLWGGECYGGTEVKDFWPDGSLRPRGAAGADGQRPRPCRMKIMKDGTRRAGDFFEVFSFIRMNRAGYLFGEKRQVDLIGFKSTSTHDQSASFDESAVSQAWNAMNTFNN